MRWVFLLNKKNIEKSGNLNDPEGIWQKILEYPGVRRVIDKLNQKGMVEDFLQEFLLEMPLRPLPKWISSRYADVVKKKSGSIPRARDRRRAKARAKRKLATGRYDPEELSYLLKLAETDITRKSVFRSFPAHVELSEAVKCFTGKWFDADVDRCSERYFSSCRLDCGSWCSPVEIAGL